MNKKFFICVIILVLLGYYGNLVFNANRYNKDEERMIKNTRKIIHYQEDRDDDVTAHKNSRDSAINREESIVQNDTCHENGDTNSTIIPQKKITSDKLPKGFDCILSIPSISLEKIVYTGDSREEHLQQYDLITATEDMKYVNGGNYIICGHYSQLYGHSLNRLKELNKGDYIYIDSNSKIYKYKVNAVTFESMTDTSSFCKQTEEKELTIISCAKYVGPDKYIVIKCKTVNE